MRGGGPCRLSGLPPFSLQCSNPLLPHSHLDRLPRLGQFPHSEEGGQVEKCLFLLRNGAQGWLCVPIAFLR